MKNTQFIQKLLSVIVSATLFVAAAPLLTTSCDATTAGESITFATGVQGATSKGSISSFTTSGGWTVQLTQAIVLMGPMYYYSGEAMTQNSLWFHTGIANACSTHSQFDYGTVLGEVFQQQAVNLLAPTVTSTGMVAGEKGTCLSMELHYHPRGDQGLAVVDENALLNVLQNDSILLTGTASNADRAIPFSARVTIPDEGTMRIVQNIEGSVPLRDKSEKPGRLLTRVFLDAWLDGVDFSTLTEVESDGVYRFTNDTQAMTALVQAVRNRYSYDFIWSQQ